MEYKKRAIGYVRVSTEEQAKEGYSLDNQRKDIEEYCKNNDIELIDIFADEGISGSSIAKRQGIINALNFIQKHKVDYIIIWKLSRLSRKVSDVARIAEILEQNNTYLISINDKIDTSLPINKMFLYFASIFAEMERDNMIVQIKGGMREKARRGEWNGGPVPLGFNLQNGKLIINNEEAEIVKIIFLEYLKGNGYKSIANMLNEMGYKTKKGNMFTGVSVKEILQNPVYAGKIRWGYLKNWNKTNSDSRRKKEFNKSYIIVNNAHEAIIDEETFNKVQQKIKNNPRHHMKQFNSNHILSGLLRCPDCLGKMSIQIVYSKGKYYEYYTCNQYSNYKTCKPNAIRKEKIEEEFFNILEKIINEPEFKEKILSSLSNSNEEIMNIEKIIKNYEIKIKNLKIKQSNLLNELIEGSEQYKKFIRTQIEEIIEEISNLERNIDTNKTIIQNLRNQSLNVEEISNLLSNFSKIIKLADNETQKNLIRKLISSIKVENKHISEITFLYNKSFRIENTTVHH